MAAGFAAAVLWSGLLGAEAQQAGAPVARFLAQMKTDAHGFDSLSLEAWLAAHPGDKSVQPKRDESGWQQEGDSEVEGRWCLRSIADTDLGNGLYVRRIALFYPRVYGSAFNVPETLPPLPTERGAALRMHGCRLAKIVGEFYGAANPDAFAHALAQQIPWDTNSWRGEDRRRYWTRVEEMVDGAPAATSVSFHVTEPRKAIDPKRATVLVEENSDGEYGPPQRDSVLPAAGEPRVEVRAAKLAEMPLADTLDMFDLLWPQPGPDEEEPPLYCERRLVPVLRRWLSTAEGLPPERHAAALLVADQVAGLVSGCTEYLEAPANPAFATPEAWQEAQAALDKDLAGMGVEVTRSAHVPVDLAYTNSLLARVHRLAPRAPVDELYRVSELGVGCIWDGRGGNDCTGIIHEAQDFLLHYPRSEFAQNVRLLMAEAIEITVASGDDSADDQEHEAMLVQAEAQLRAWFMSSKNERDRALVWDEVWALDAGLPPWLFLPDEIR